MPKRSGRTEYALLGLLADGPRSGYDIKKEVEQVLSHFWTESYGNIYPTLRRLHEDGLADRRSEPSQSGPPRSVYSITQDGLAELQDWLTRPARIGPPRNELLLKLFFGRHAEPGALKGVVEAYRSAAVEIQERLEQARTQVERSAPDNADAVYWLMTVRLGLATLPTIIAWCDDVLDTLPTLTPPEDP